MVGCHVRTNIGVVGAILRHKGARQEEERIKDRALSLIDYVGLNASSAQAASTLSYGDQRRLEIARALATSPKVLALDEPAAGMNPTETSQLRELLVRIREDGITILLIEHDVKLVMGLCDTVAVLDYGIKIAEGEAVRDSVESGGHSSISWGRCTMNLLRLNNFKVAYGGIKAVKGVSLSVDFGEVVALIGSNGAGKTSLLKAICGLVDYQGQIEFKGENINKLRCDQLAKLGLSMVPEGRGIFTRLTVEENLLMGAFLVNDKKDIAKDKENMFRMFPRLEERRAQIAGTLSGGEQQMLAIGRSLMGRPDLLLLDEPSMGLAPLMVEKIFEVINQISSSRVTILLVEQNAKLALEYASRGYVMNNGEITLEGPSGILLSDSSVRKAYLGE